MVRGMNNVEFTHWGTGVKEDMGEREDNKNINIYREEIYIDINDILENMWGKRRDKGPDQE